MRAKSSKVRELRLFGLLFSSLLFFLYFRFLGQSWTSYLMLALAISLFLVALLRPIILSKPFNYWMRIARKIGKVMAPVELGIIYFVVLTPFALVFRLMKGLSRKNLREVDSAWESGFESINPDYFRRAY